MLKAFCTSFSHFIDCLKTDDDDLKVIINNIKKDINKCGDFLDKAYPNNSFSNSLGHKSLEAFIGHWKKLKADNIPLLNNYFNTKNILNDYVKHALSFISKNNLKNLKIAVDAGNGMAGTITPLIYGKLEVKIVPLYFKLDGTFPNHLADPSKYENMRDLQKAVKKQKCDYGMAFDGDADRVFFVDERGQVVNSSLISALIILWKNILLHWKSTSRTFLACLHC